jgi:hypothetical protein
VPERCSSDTAVNRVTRHSWRVAAGAPRSCWEQEDPSRNPLTLQLTVPAQEPTIAAPTQDTLARKASIVASKMRYRQTQSRIHNYEKLLNKALWKFLAEHAQKEF